MPIPVVTLALHTRLQMRVVGVGGVLTVPVTVISASHPNPAAMDVLVKVTTRQPLGSLDVNICPTGDTPLKELYNATAPIKS